VSLRLEIQSGGEIYWPFAKRKLAEMKAFMRQANLPALTKHFWVNSTDRIWIESHWLTRDYFGVRPASGVLTYQDVFLDWIRIEAGGGLWDFYAQNDQGIFVAVIDATLTQVLPGTATIHKTSRALGRSWLLATDAGQLKTVAPEQKVTRVRSGEFDSYTHELFMAGPTEGPGFAAVSIDSSPPTNPRAFYTKDKATLPSGSPTTFQRLYATEDDFFYAQDTATSVIRVYDLDGDSLLVDSGGAASYVVSQPESTFRDVLVPRARRTSSLNATTELVSKKHGLLPGFDTVATSNLNLDFVRAAANRDHAYAFMVAEHDFAFSVAVSAAHSIFDPDTGALTGYTTTGAGPKSLTDSATGAYTSFGFIATKTRAYGFFEEFYTATVDYTSFSDTGDSVVLLSNAGLSIGFSVLVSTPENAWLVLALTSNTIYLFNQAGLVQTFSILATTGGGQAALVYAGHVGETVFFRVRTASNQWQLIGSDGTNVDIRAGLPTGFSPGAGVGGHVWAPEKNETYWVWGGIIPNPADPPVPANVTYVFHRPRATTFKSYAIATGTAATVDVPDRSTSYNHEEF